MLFASAPARVCLFGEHQDYLQLKVIPAAINLRLLFYANSTEQLCYRVKSLDLQQSVIIPTSLNELSANSSFLSYLEAGYLSLKKQFPDENFVPLDVEISSEIPLESGLSSSAALLVGWISLIAHSSNIKIDHQTVAELAYIAEHDILKIPCGKMDQYSSAIGSIISLDLKDENKVKFQIFDHPDLGIVVVNSCVPKKTNDVHSKIVTKSKKVVFDLFKKSSTSIREITMEQLEKYKLEFSSTDYELLKAIVSIRDDTEKAEVELSKYNPDLKFLGSLLTSQQTALREGIGVSLPILDKIVNLGIKFGALGGKLTGAGLGGCVVILTYNDEKDSIASKLRNELSLPVWAVNVDEGVKFFKKE
ncbi:MAG: hypothetical protein K9W46_06260 [Candidatus Heimdallarchaeum endolithica]|uniref:Mevalonate kinase n=1 Tax=Candidatus Heimdallarchaeum endolithica TaxID=2876572 RepID=A0A9Y1BTD7_9ARCH|nr:MAG: hypothetical protein K9W46_06260 [Candidatus Heimdallarchaeum endolithica]